MPASIDVKGRYRIFTWPGNLDTQISTYNSLLCVVRRPNDRFFTSVQQYIPGIGLPFTVFSAGSSYSMVTRSDPTMFSITNNNAVTVDIPQALNVKSPLFTLGLDKESIVVPISSYIFSDNNRMQSIITTRANSEGYYNNLTLYNVQLVKDLNIVPPFTHFYPNSSYEIRNSFPNTNAYSFFAPYISEMGDYWALGNNSLGQFGMGHLFNSNYPLYRNSSLTGILSTDKIFGKWHKIVENQGSVMALSANGSKLKLFVCGDNTYGQLGLGHTETPISVFTNVPGNWKDIMPGKHSLAVNENNLLYSCGLNTSGQLGLGNTSPVYVFTQVNSLNSTPIYTTINSICLS